MNKAKEQWVWTPSRKALTVVKFLYYGIGIVGLLLTISALSLILYNHLTH